MRIPAVQENKDSEVQMKAARKGRRRPARKNKYGSGELRFERCVAWEKRRAGGAAIAKSMD
jgi:hypothetical protein